MKRDQSKMREAIDKTVCFAQRVELELRYGDIPKVVVFALLLIALMFCGCL